MFQNKSCQIFLDTMLISKNIRNYDNTKPKSGLGLYSPSVFATLRPDKTPRRARGDFLSVLGVLCPPRSSVTETGGEFFLASQELDFTVP
jgi:hypothetical protein